MKTTTNYGFKKPEPNDPYNVNDINESFDIIDATLKAASDKADTVTTHPSDLNNPHQTTAAQIGLGNVPNVSTNDQTPTYTIATANAALSSGEKLSVAFGKIAKAVSTLISHIADTVGHITATERTTWNSKANGTHTHTKSQITDFPTSMTPTTHTHTKSQITDFPTTMTPAAHNQAASTITAGTLAGKVRANASAITTLGDGQVRDIYAGTTDMVAGSTTMNTGAIYIMYE